MKITKSDLKTLIKEELEKAISEQVDDDAVHELILYIENDRGLYRQQHIPIKKNLITKIAKDMYDPQKAIKLMMYLVDAGAKKYAKEFGNPAEWNLTFPKQVRLAVAKNLLEQFEEEAKDGELNDLLPKKYQKVQEESDLE